MSKTTTGSAEEGEKRSEVSRDELFEILSNRRRRFVLHYLVSRAGESVELGALEKQVAAWENGVPVEELSYDDRKSVHISLYQHHLQKMDKAGLLDYDKRGGRVELTTDPSTFDVYLETVPEPWVPWDVYFPSLTVACFLLVLVGWTNVSTVPDGWWVGIVLLALGASSIGYVYDRRFRVRSRDLATPPEVAE